MMFFASTMRSEEVYGHSAIEHLKGGMDATNREVF
jgi:hypothetical protein